MNNNQKRDLCLAVMRADSEAELIDILTLSGLWGNYRVWRLYGDRENNFSTIGNQQNRPDAALVEKLINSVDARLMHECLSRGINPESPAAPQSIREAVGRFFEEGRIAGSIYGGQIRAWDNEMRRDVARGISLAATGAKPQEGELCKEVEQELEDLLKNHAGLRALRERRRREEIESRIEDSKPLEQILETLLKQSPTLANLFLFGKHASNPFKQIKVGSEEKPFEGKNYPTYFKFKGKEYGQVLNRETHIHIRCRILFETNAANDYLSRGIDAGVFTLFVTTGEGRQEAKDAGFACNVNLQNGIASLSIKLSEACTVGDKLLFTAVANDSTRLEPFENAFSVVVQKAMDSTGGKGERQKPPKDEPGDEREVPGGIEIPKPIQVRQEDWEKMQFDQFTALQIKDSGERGDSGTGQKDVVVYDFLINVDNVHLKRFLKAELKSGEDDKVAQTRFELGMMLVTLAIIHQDRADQRRVHTQGEGDEVKTESLEDRVAQVTKALAPFLLPMIGALGALDQEKVAAGSASGEAT